MESEFAIFLSKEQTMTSIARKNHDQDTLFYRHSYPTHSSPSTAAIFSAAAAMN